MAARKKQWSPEETVVAGRNSSCHEKQWFTRKISGCQKRRNSTVVARRNSGCQKKPWLQAMELVVEASMELVKEPAVELVMEPKVEHVELVTDANNGAGGGARSGACVGVVEFVKRFGVQRSQVF